MDHAHAIPTCKQTSVLKFQASALMCCREYLQENVLHCSILTEKSSYNKKLINDYYLNTIKYHTQQKEC